MRNTVDPDKLKSLREERRWSQEELAGIAGIGVRTVQRIEKGKSASRATLSSLAAAFDVDAAALAMEPGGDAQQRADLEAARKLAGLRLSFWIHLVTYIFVIALLLAINFADEPKRIWVLWPAIGWGIGVAAHGAAAIIATYAAKAQRRVEAG
ncbi:MAG: helix-turn-helix domain-containing protein [Pseudomonadota bacterium]